MTAPDTTGIVERLRETRTPGNCVCGEPLLKVTNSRVPTMWVNGDRYIYPETTDESRFCVFRCRNCSAVVDESFRPFSEAVAKAREGI